MFHFIHSSLQSKKKPATTSNSKLKLQRAYAKNERSQLLNKDLLIGSSAMLTKPNVLSCTASLTYWNSCEGDSEICAYSLLFLSLHIWQIVAFQAIRKTIEIKAFPLSFCEAHCNSSDKLPTALFSLHSCRAFFHILMDKLQQKKNRLSLDSLSF